MFYCNDGLLFFFIPLLFIAWDACGVAALVVAYASGKDHLPLMIGYGITAIAMGLSLFLFVGMFFSQGGQSERVRFVGTKQIHFRQLSWYEEKDIEQGKWKPVELPKLTEAIQRKGREAPDNYPEFTVRELKRELKSMGVSHWMRGTCVKVTESDGKGGSRANWYKAMTDGVDSVAIRFCWAISCGLACDDITSYCGKLAASVEVEQKGSAEIELNVVARPSPREPSQDTAPHKVESGLASTLEAAGLAKLASAVDKAGIESTEELLAYEYATLAAELEQHGGVVLTPAQERKLRALLGAPGDESKA